MATFPVSGLGSLVSRRVAFPETRSQATVRARLSYKLGFRFATVFILIHLLMQIWVLIQTIRRLPIDSEVLPLAPVSLLCILEFIFFLPFLKSFSTAVQNLATMFSDALSL